jgi:hypothetical protein
MSGRSGGLHAGISEVNSIYTCLLCRNRVITNGANHFPAPLARNESSLVGVCKDCQERYLSIGVALVNPASESVIVVTEEAFRNMFDQPIPEERILYVEDSIIEKVYGLFLVSQEARAHIARARQFMLN